MRKKKRRNPLLLIGISVMLLTGCGQEGKTEELRSFAVWEKVSDAACTFSDGVTAEKWKNEDEETGQYRYRLEDGTDILEITDLYSLGTESDDVLSGMQGLSEQAREKVTAFYQEQGRLYDLNAALERAYQDYRNCEKNRDHFTCHTITQDVTQSAELTDYIVVLTAVTIPKKDHFDGGSTCSYQSEVFHRQTGEQLDLWELFARSEQEVKEELAGICAPEDTTVSEGDVASVMDQCQLLLFQDYLEVWFPYGTWERQEFDKGFGFEYDKIEGLLYDWAVPAEIGNE